MSKESIDKNLTRFGNFLLKTFQFKSVSQFANKFISLYFTYCWRWLIEERVDEFVIEKYIEINKGISIQILALIMLQYNRSDIEHVHIFIAKDVKKKVNLVTLAEGNKKQQ